MKQAILKNYGTPLKLAKRNIFALKKSSSLRGICNISIAFILIFSAPVLLKGQSGGLEERVNRIEKFLSENTETVKEEDVESNDKTLKSQKTQNQSNDNNSRTFEHTNKSMTDAELDARVKKIEKFLYENTEVVKEEEQLSDKKPLASQETTESNSSSIRGNTPANTQYINKGMTKTEVISILGKPDYDGGNYIKYGVYTCLNFVDGRLIYWVGLENKPFSNDSLQPISKSSISQMSVHQSSSETTGLGSIFLTFNLNCNTLFVDQWIEVYDSAGRKIGSLVFKSKKGRKRTYSGEILLSPGSYFNINAICFVSLGNAFARSPYKLNVNFSSPLQVTSGTNPNLTYDFNL